MTDLLNTANNKTSHPGRWHEIDWLRSLAFILLIFYHIGMYYVADWGWHVKSAYQSENLKALMLMLNPWRMPLIFFLSGFALCLVESKVTMSMLVKIRFTRLFIPLIFGMIVIVAPQAYYEAVQKYGFDDGFWAFWTVYLDPTTEVLPQMQHSPLGLITWNHLWYLAYLWAYTLVYVAIRPILRKVGLWISHSKVPAYVFFFGLITGISVIEFYLEPIFPRTHALIDDWYNHARYFLLFVTGYVMAQSGWLYRKLIDHCWVWVGAALPLYLCSLMIHNGHTAIDSVLPHPILKTSLLVTNALCWLFGVVALCGRFMTKHNKLLDYLNQAVLPWYILHQSVVIVLAMALARISMGGALEATTLTIGTFALCALLFHFIQKFNVSRFLFGMKLKRG